MKPSFLIHAERQFSPGGKIMVRTYKGDYKGKRNGTLYCVRWFNNQYVIYCHAGNYNAGSFDIVYKRPADMRIFLLRNDCMRVS